MQVVYGDSPGFNEHSTLKRALTTAGLYQVAQRYSIEMGDFEKGRAITLPSLKNSILDTINIANACFDDDPVAIDSTFCRMVVLRPDFVPTNVLGAEKKLGTYNLDEIEYVGEPYQNFINTGFRVTRAHAGTWSLFSRRPVIIEDQCTRCGVCIKVCPVDGKAVRFTDHSKKNPLKPTRCLNSLLL